MYNDKYIYIYISIGLTSEKPFGKGLKYFDMPKYLYHLVPVGKRAVATGNLHRKCVSLPPAHEGTFLAKMRWATFTQEKHTNNFQITPIMRACLLHVQFTQESARACMHTTTQIYFRQLAFKMLIYRKSKATLAVLKVMWAFQWKNAYIRHALKHRARRAK